MTYQGRVPTFTITLEFEGRKYGATFPADVINKTDIFDFVYDSVDNLIKEEKVR